jgi:dipeptidyl aminopeptidase/acylaminoacyl peptidase
MACRLLAAASAAALLCASGPALAQAVVLEPPPAAAFGRIPALEDVQISPDGKRLALLGSAPDQDVLNIVGIDDQSVVTLPFGEYDTRGVQWAGDGQLVVSASIYQHPSWAKPNVFYHFTRSVIVTREGKLVGGVLSNSPDAAYALSLPVASVVESGKSPELIVLAPADNKATQDPMSRLKKESDDYYASGLWRVDAATGRGKLDESGPPGVYLWGLDLNGEARVRGDEDLTSHRSQFMVRPKGKRAWETISRSAPGEDRIGYLGYSDAEDAIYYAVVEGGGEKVARRTLKDGAVTMVGPAQPARDVGMLWDPRRKSPVAIVSYGLEPKYEWLDPEIGGVFNSMSRAFKGKQVILNDWSADRTKFVLMVEGGAAPPSWYLYDKAAKSVSPIQDSYPELKDAQLGAKSAIAYKARDGLEIPAWLTLPPGMTASAARKLPLIVLPHGGPHSRDDSGFDYLSQFLASRGYAVLQPQFRGSTGFGSDFVRKGYKEWGGKMQTDLLDGIADLAGKGTVDPARVCIVGWSYGGYAALAGATLHPEAYKCAASINGVSDLQMLLGENLRMFAGDGFDLEQTVGDAELDKALLIAQSPAQHADQARAPILLIAGRADTTVPFEQTERMHRALTAEGKKVELVTFEGDDHYLRSNKSRIPMLQALEVFLKANLPAG